MKKTVSIVLATLLVACGDSTSPGLASLELSPDSIQFSAIGDSILLSVHGTDSDGRAVELSTVRFASRNPEVARVSLSGTVESSGEGATYIVAEAEDRTDSVRITASQARDSLLLSVPVPGTIMTLARDAAFPLTCRVFDAGGTLLPVPTSVSSRTGRVAGGACGALVARVSGHDTLDVTAGAYQASLPVVVAIRPEVLSDPAIPLAVDSLPRGLIPWAPTLVMSSAGELNLYFAGYREYAGQLGGRRGDLHRLVSNDGVHFSYDGIALARDAFPCSPRGTGIENVALVPRNDGPGWRLFFAAGSDECHGWQVFSATSDDQQQWTSEPGIRIPNGSTPRWPAGEGMDLALDSPGVWRMLVGSYERVTPAEDRFQITQWTSPDQITWSYGGPVLTTRQVGPGAARSVYSPSVTDIAPGLQRMFFTGDNLDVPGGGSRIYSAVSINGENWQVEGVVLGGGAVDYYYSTVVGDLLVFIRTVAGKHALGIVRIGPPAALP